MRRGSFVFAVHSLLLSVHNYVTILVQRLLNAEMRGRKMFCSKCGSKLQDADVFCTTCGTKVVKSQPPVQPDTAVQPRPSVQPQFQPRPVQPYVAPQQPVMQPPVVPAVAVDKRTFLNLPAYKQVATKHFLSRILAIVCAVLMLVSYFIFMGTSVEDIPVGSVILELSDSKESVMVSKEQMEVYAEFFDYYFDHYGANLPINEAKIVRKFARITGNCAEKLSIHNLKRLDKACEDICGIDDLRYYVSSSDFSDLQELVFALNIISVFVLIGAIFCMLFLFFGGFNQVTALSIVGIVFAEIFCMLFCGILWSLLILAVSVVMVYLGTTVNSAYSNYRRFPVNV